MKPNQVPWGWPKCLRNLACCTPNWSTQVWGEITQQCSHHWTNPITRCPQSSLVSTRFAMRVMKIVTKPVSSPPPGVIVPQQRPQLLATAVVPSSSVWPRTTYNSLAQVPNLSSSGCPLKCSGANFCFNVGLDYQITVLESVDHDIRTLKFSELRLSGSSR